MTEHNDMRAVFERLYPLAKEMRHPYYPERYDNDHWQERWIGFQVAWQARAALDVKKLKRVREALAEAKKIAKELCHAYGNPYPDASFERWDKLSTEIDQLIGEQESSRGA